MLNKNIEYLDKFIKTPFLKWSYLSESGFSLSEIEEMAENSYLKKMRTYFSNSPIDINSKEDFILFLSNHRKFNEDKAKELSDLYFSRNKKMMILFFEEFNEIISKKNHDIDYYLLRGWSSSESKKMIRDFFRRGPESIKEKRKNHQYDNDFKRSRKRGAEKSHTIQGESKKPSIEREIEISLSERGHILSKFYTPCVHPELSQLFNKKNFIHDFFVDDKYIIEYNGSYWHKDFITFPDKFSKEDYMFEIKKAYNILDLVKREIPGLKYIIIWESDFDHINEIIGFLESSFEKDLKFISSREMDMNLYDEYKEEAIKEDKKNILFGDVVSRISLESHCESKKVAAIAVKNGRRIATGINGTPEGITNCDDYWRGEYIERGIKIPYDEWKKTPEWRIEHHNWSNNNEIHAEQALICEAARNGISLSDVDIYISLEPCIHCSKLLSALKPNRVFYVNSYDLGTGDSKSLLNKAGIILRKV